MAFALDDLQVYFWHSTIPWLYSVQENEMWWNRSRPGAQIWGSIRREKPEWRLLENSWMQIPAPTPNFSSGLMPKCHIDPWLCFVFFFHYNFEFSHLWNFLFCFRIRQTNIRIRSEGRCEESNIETTPLSMPASVSTPVFMITVSEPGGSPSALLNWVMDSSLAREMILG